MEIKVDGLRVIYDKDGFNIINSYQITSKKRIREILQNILKKFDDEGFWLDTERSQKSLEREWIAHNKLYKYHLFRNHTRDCFFEAKQSIALVILYWIFGHQFEISKKIKKVKQFFQIKKQEKKYKKYIKEHRNNVKLAFEELNSNAYIYQLCGKEILEQLKERIEKHDLSKYSKEEFDAYRKNFFPINEGEKQTNKENFDKAWEHHWKNNSHHWQHRQDKTSFSEDNAEEVLDVLENVCDWLAMGYKFNDRPYQYYNNNKEQIKLCDEERKYLEHILYDIIDYVPEEEK